MSRFVVVAAVLGFTVSIFALIALSGARTAYACSCGPVSAERYVDRADTIVVGRVKEVVVRRLGRSLSRGDPDPIVTVERYLKGTGPFEILVDDPIGGGDCGYFSEDSVGKDYLIFLRGESSPFKSDLCTGIRLLSVPPSTEFLATVESITGTGFLPDPTIPNATIDSGANAAWIAIVVGIFLSSFLIMGAGAIGVRRFFNSGK